MTNRPVSGQRAVQLRVVLIGALGLAALVSFTVLAVLGRATVAERMAVLSLAVGCGGYLAGAPRNEPPPPSRPDLAADLLKNGV